MEAAGGPLQLRPDVVAVPVLLYLLTAGLGLLLFLQGNRVVDLLMKVSSPVTRQVLRRRK